MKEKNLFTAETQRRRDYFVSLRLCSKSSLLIALLLASYSLKAQSVKSFSTLKEYEIALKPLAKELLKALTNEERNKANKNFIALFEEALQIRESFSYNFDSLINLKVLTSDDKKLRIYTWTLFTVDGNHYEYYGYVQLLKRKPGLIGFFSPKRYIMNIRLKDGTVEIPDPQNSKLKPERWYGAWYYKLITSEYLGKPYYTLLGWKGNNKLTTIKVIDNISVSGDGKLTFGVPIFRDENIVKNREVFEFSAMASMSLHYEANNKISAYEKTDPRNKKRLVEYKNCIVFDHVVPSESKLEGQRQFYGPDLSIDAYYFSKGKWLMLHDANDKPAPPMPPAKFRRPKELYSPLKKK